MKLPGELSHQLQVPLTRVALKNASNFIAEIAAIYLQLKFIQRQAKRLELFRSCLMKLFDSFFRWKIIKNSGRRSSRQRCDQRTVKLQHLFDLSAVAWKETQTNAARLLNPHFENLLESSWINWNYAIAMAHASRRWPIFVPQPNLPSSAICSRDEK